MAMRRSAFSFPLNDADVMKYDTVFVNTSQSDPTPECGQATRVFQQGYFLSIMRLVLAASAALRWNTAVSKCFAQLNLKDLGL